MIGFKEEKTMKDKEELIHEWCGDCEPPSIFSDWEQTNVKASDYAKMNRGDCHLIKTYMHVLEVRALEYERNCKPCVIIDINSRPLQER